jgi:hypothetical protein
MQYRKIYLEIAGGLASHAFKERKFAKGNYFPELTTGN